VRGRRGWLWAAALLLPLPTAAFLGLSSWGLRALEALVVVIALLGIPRGPVPREEALPAPPSRGPAPALSVPEELREARRILRRAGKSGSALDASSRSDRGGEKPGLSPEEIERVIEEREGRTE